MGDEIKYVDFEITIKKDKDDEYLVLAKSGRGKAQTRFANPFNEDKRKILRSTLTAAALRSATGRKAKVRGSATPEVREMKNFGSMLFSEVINGPVSDFYKKCEAQAQPVRLRLTLDQSVDDLPWEFLCANDDFIALNPDSPVVRYIEGTEPCSLVKVEYPLRVLIVIAKPSDEVPLDTDAEKNSIAAALKPLVDQNLVQLDFIEGANTWGQLISALRPNRTHILHFIGHGAFDEKNGEGVLVMADADGKTELVDSERLRYLVKGRSRLALVVLNSCLGTQGDDGQPFSSVAAGLVKSGIPAVIAMQFEISDESARVIAETFYTSLSLNLPVDAALTEARRQIFLSDKNNLEWATPILYMQVPDGQLFEFKGPRPVTKASSVDNDSFKQNAERRYREGDEAMKRGDWAAAVTAFRGAMVYVPDYRDAAEKLTECARRGNAANLQAKAERAISEKNYDQALQMIEEAIQMDSKLDLTTLRETAECGQKYQRAIAELQCGNAQGGAELLRELIVRRADFEDAAWRLNDLASGGTGLPGGQRPMPNRGLVPTSPQPGAQTGGGWGAKWNQLTDWLNATPEVQYKPSPGQSNTPPPAREDLVDKGKELWKGMFGSANAPAPPATGPTNQSNMMPPSMPAPNVSAVSPTPNQVAPSPAPDSGSVRVYEVANGSGKQLAEQIRLYFFKTGFQNQIVEQPHLWIVQGTKGGVRRWVGMGLAATMIIESSGDNLKISIGGGRWVEQGAFVVAGFVTGGLTWITGGIGLGQQKSLIDDLWGIVERFVAGSGGRRVG